MSPLNNTEVEYLIYFMYIFIYITYYTVFLTSVSICKFITIPNRSVSRTIPDKYPELYGGKKIKMLESHLSDFFFNISCRKKILSSLP